MKREEGRIKVKREGKQVKVGESMGTRGNARESDAAELRRTQPQGDRRGEGKPFVSLKGIYSPLFWRGAGVRLFGEGQGMRLYLKYSSSSFSALASEFGRSLMMVPFSMRAMRELMSMVCWRLWLEMRMVAPVCLL